MSLRVCNAIHTTDWSEGDVKSSAEWRTFLLTATVDGEKLSSEDRKEEWTNIYNAIDRLLNEELGDDWKRAAGEVVVTMKKDE